MNIKRWAKNKKIGVLYGGISAEREISLLSGRAVIDGLRGEGLNVVGIDVDRKVSARIAKEKIDFAFITLHGPMGEDGTIQGMLEIMGIPYSGCGVLASALSMNKMRSKEVFAANGIPTPAWEIKRQGAKRSTKFGFPVVVKPLSQGSALGVSIANDNKNYNKALTEAFKFGAEVMVEKFVGGTEITVGVLGNKALPIVEIVPKGKFYDFKSKYTPGQSDHIIPARLNKKTADLASRLAVSVFNALGCRAVGRVDIIIDKHAKPWVLEMNTLPGMTSTSLLPDEAKAAGMSFGGLLLKIIEYSLC